VQIVTAIDTNMSPMDCLQMKMQGMKLTNCIFASREIAFIPHTPITLPIEITLDCKDIDCTQGETCDHGVCRSNMASGMGCTGGGPCTEGLVDASPDVSGPPADASSDLSVQDSLVTDQFVDQAMADTVTDVPGSDEAPGSDATVEDASDATTTDAPGDVLEASIDASPDTSHVDAAVEAAADATTDAGFDATADAGADSPVDAPGEGPPPSDAGGSPDVLGGCVGAGSPKVPCGASTCSSGQICCVTNQLASAPTEACTSPSSCPIQATGYPFYWALSCRNSSDCPSSAPICCYQPADAGSGTVSNCATSCPTGFGQTKIGCQNGCECTAVGGTCAQVTCYGGFYGICGNGGGACP
jgi:hypothetical protein